MCHTGIVLFLFDKIDDFLLSNHGPLPFFRTLWLFCAILNAIISGLAGASMSIYVGEAWQGLQNGELF
jgi:hypothetical protein